MKHNRSTIVRRQRSLIFFLLLFVFVLLASNLMLAHKIASVNTPEPKAAQNTIAQPQEPRTAAVDEEGDKPISMQVSPAPLYCGTLDEMTAQILKNAADEFDVPYLLALAVVEQESDGQNIIGDGGDSVGYMQIQKKWWAGLMRDIGADDLSDPEDNFRTGCAILAFLMDEHDSVVDALSAYNTGRGGRTSYSDSVLAIYGGYEA